VLAYNDIFGIDDSVAAKLSSGFGGGIGRLREVCGSVSGMVMLAGMLCPADKPDDRTAKTRNYALVQEVAADFKALNGSIVCRELLGLSPMGTTVINPSDIHGIPESPVPSDRTPEYYKKRPCEELVKIAARIVGERISNK
jgi:C_GCAxxG_C_C family probable redox protein